MRKITFSILAILMSSFVMAQDNCNNALTIVAGTTYTVDEVLGSQVPEPICASNGNGANAGMWYSYTSAIDQSLIISTDLQQNSGRDTRFHVYSGDCGNLSCFNGDDDGGSGFLSYAHFNVAANTTYIIAFDNRWESTGFDFLLTEGATIAEPEGIISFTPTSVNTTGDRRAAVDMNGDYLDDIVSISRNSVNINYQLSGGGFETVDIPTPEADFTPSWSLTAGDIDGNEKNDLLYGGGSGVTFMFAFDDDTGQYPLAFVESSGSEYVFSQRSNMVDFDNDGDLDAFVCHDVEPNVYYINNGTLNDDGTPNMTFVQGGLGDTVNGGNYGSIWVDYDNDHDMDLFIAKCRGGSSSANINQLHKNNGNGVFEEIGSSVNLADNVQTWSSAWGDYDNDGYMDAFIGASSTSNGSHKFMHNQEGTTDREFVDITAGSGFDSFSPVNTENVTHDFNNDGFLDVFTGAGYILFNNGDMTFTQQELGFGIGPIGDLNNDGFLDILSNGSLQLNDGNDNNWLKINLIGVDSNWNGIGARVEIVSNLGTQIRDVRAGDGFRYMGSLNVHFGLGQDEEIERVTVYWPIIGNVDTIENPAINSTLVIREGESLSVAEVNDLDIKIFPNPTQDILNVSGFNADATSRMRITNIEGKVISEKPFTQNTINVSSLAEGLYFLSLTKNDQTQTIKFVKK